MTLKKLSGPTNPCLSPSHDPPGMIVLENGTYEWTCPACGKKQVFVVNRPTF